MPGTIDALVEAFRLRGLSAGEAVSVLLAGADISVVVMWDGSECRVRVPAERVRERFGMAQNG